MKIIGRETEKRQLKMLYESEASEFLMVYGRRRVGKTFLIREFFNHQFVFCLTGIANGTRAEQLMNFRNTMLRYDERIGSILPKNWLEAFEQLTTYLEKTTTQRKVIFLDELPWIDTPKSDFVKALELFWNSWASARNDVLLIVCGSAASWMVKNIVRNHGGLHNRLTYKMKINPFSLRESREFLHEKGIKWTNRMIAECYMVMGGIPYYLNLLDKSLSLAQNIDKMFFAEAPLLEDEFANLYHSLFKHAEDYILIIEALAKKKTGFTREEIMMQTKMSDGGGLTRKLDELEQCGFIRKYMTTGAVSALYQLVDFFSLFYFHFLKNASYYDTDNWIHLMGTPKYNTWCGLSFERLCFAHLPQIKQVLGISGVSTKTYSYYTKDAQIDMVIDRGDHIINICEMKFTDMPFSIGKKYADILKNKIYSFKASLKKPRSIYLIMIASDGLQQNEFATSLVQNTIMLDELFCI